MRFRDNPEEAYRRLEVIIDEMEGESDRAVAIVGVAWVEEALADSISAFLQSHGESSKRLFGGNGPLASFSAKIDLARLLGVITNTVWADLHRLREVRNEFAHQLAQKKGGNKLAFTANHVRDKCLSLKCVAHEKHDNPRVAFVRACVTLNADFDIFTLCEDRISVAHQVFARGVDKGI